MVIFSQLFSGPGIKLHFKMQVIMKPVSATGNSRRGKKSLYENTSTSTTSVHDGVGTVILRFPATPGHTLLHNSNSPTQRFQEEQLDGSREATSPLWGHKAAFCCGTVCPPTAFSVPSTFPPFFRGLARTAPTDAAVPQLPTLVLPMEEAADGVPYPGLQDGEGMRGAPRLLD